MSIGSTKKSTYIIIVSRVVRVLKFGVGYGYGYGYQKNVGYGYGYGSGTDCSKNTYKSYKDPFFKTKSAFSIYA